MSWLSPLRSCTRAAVLIAACAGLLFAGAPTTAHATMYSTPEWMSVSAANFADVPAVAEGTTSGSLDVANPRDFWKVYVPDGFRLDVSLTGNAENNDFELFLYTHDATTIGASALSDYGVETFYPEEVSRDSGVDGWNYIEVYRGGGSGAYSMRCTLTAIGGDGNDDLGSAIQPLASPVAGTVARAQDVNDFYRVYVSEGQCLTAWLSSMPTSCSVSLSIYGPGAVNLGSFSMNSGSTTPPRVSQEADVSGWHYVRVKAASGGGVGQYSLKWALATGDGNQDTGVAQQLSASVTSSIDELSDMNDVYKVYANSGDFIDLTLSAPSSVDFELSVYSPSTVSIFSASPLGGSGSSGYPRRLGYTTTTTGWHYVRVYACQGSGTYSLGVQVYPGDGNADIPFAQNLPASPVSSSADSRLDSNDVYRVYASVGDVIDMGLTAPNAVDFALHLYGPSASSIAASPEQSMNYGTYPRRVARTVSIAGWYYIRVNAVSGAASYSLSWRVFPGDGDDEIVGAVDAASSPFTASVDEYTDRNDVYRVHVAAGEVIDVSLDTSAVGDFELYLYAPGETSILNTPLSSNTSGGLPRRAGWCATTSGWHYIRVRANAGSGTYALSWNTSPGDGNDDISGAVAMTSTAVTSRLDEMSDRNDVYKVYAAAGDFIDLSLSTEGARDYELYLYSPAATSILSASALGSRGSGTYPRWVGYTAATSGWYYIRARTYAGSGPYELKVSVVDVISDVGNEDIGSSVEPTSSVIVGTLSNTTDLNDVYRIMVSRGDRLDFALNAGSSTNFDLYVYGPGSTGITGAAVASSAVVPYPETGGILAPADGWYYVCVRATSGSGTYSLAWSATPAPPDANPPYIICGVPIQNKDVAQISLSASDMGWGLSAFQYRLDGAATVTVAGSMVNLPPVTGLGSHSISVVASDLAGNITTLVRDFDVYGTSILALWTSNASPDFSAAVTLSARLSREGQGAPLTGRTVVFERQDAAGWVVVGSAGTNESGIAVMSIVPSGNSATVYRARFETTGEYAETSSSSVSILPKAYVSNPVAPATMYVGKAKYVYSILKPRHAPGTSPVRIYRYRYVSGRWKAYGYVNARAVDYAGYSKCVGAVKLAYRGKWRLRVFAPADSGHIAAWSTGYDYVTVK